MKKLIIILVLLIAFITPVFSLSPVDLKFAYGKWTIENSRLYQNDLKAGMARVDIPLKQDGTMVYEFNVRYEDGGTDDMHAGFGIHIFVDKPAPGKAWGNGKSYLLWLNYDENPKGITKGLSAQVYKSTGHSRMELISDTDLNEYAENLSEEALEVIIPFKMEVNGDTGDVKIYDPVDPEWVYKFNLGNTEPLKGNFMSLRTNSMGISFGL